MAGIEAWFKVTDASGVVVALTTDYEAAAAVCKRWGMGSHIWRRNVIDRPSSATMSVVSPTTSTVTPARSRAGSCRALPPCRETRSRNCDR